MRNAPLLLELDPEMEEFLLKTTEDAMHFGLAGLNMTKNPETLKILVDNIEMNKKLRAALQAARKEMD